MSSTTPSPEVKPAVLDTNKTQNGHNHDWHVPTLHIPSFHPTMRPREDDAPEDWWFASIAIPLLAATIGPLANVLSIAALVSYWREDISMSKGAALEQLNGVPIKDPHWATGLNVASLVTGYVGNAFLFFNMTNRVRYLVALPMTIFLWVVSSMIVSWSARRNGSSTVLILHSSLDLPWR
jgi:potassium channel subfamily K